MKEQNRMLAEKIMNEFAERTGLAFEKMEKRRYLWTDAFAVCDFVELFSTTGDEKYKKLALDLVEQVHQTLGRHREDDSRSGWISGLDEEKGSRHPTMGGLRIGKKLNERKTYEPPDDRMEWIRDGQYFHYLTKWMRALECMARAFENPKFHAWAIELAKAAHKAFAYIPPNGGKKRMHWKMSIDMSRPLVASMGQHDPLDGFVTYSVIYANADDREKELTESNLDREILEMEEICSEMHWSVDDPLGIGGLLCDAYTLAFMLKKNRISNREILKRVLEACPPSLEAYEDSNEWRLPPESRLPFRELGLCIGLKAAVKLRDLVEGSPDAFGRKSAIARNVRELERFLSLTDVLEKFWLEPANQKSSTWSEHEDINAVMLATSLVPETYLNPEAI